MSVIVGTEAENMVKIAWKFGTKNIGITTLQIIYLSSLFEKISIWFTIFESVAKTRVLSFGTLLSQSVALACWAWSMFYTENWTHFKKSFTFLTVLRVRYLLFFCSEK